MATVKLGTRPKTFQQLVSIPLHEGGEGTIKAVYRYRTRTEYGRFIDELMEAAQVKLAGESQAEVKYSLELALTKTVAKNADYLMQIMDGWNLEQDFTLENVRQLCDELTGAAAALIHRYGQVIEEGRLGN